MPQAKRLVKFGVRFKGPHSPELFKAMYVESPHFDHNVIGTGESKAVAAMRALSHLHDLDLGRKVRADIETQLQATLPGNASYIEAAHPDLNVYCTIGITVER